MQEYQENKMNFKLLCFRTPSCPSTIYLFAALAMVLIEWYLANSVWYCSIAVQFFMHIFYCAQLPSTRALT